MGIDAHIANSPSEILIFSVIDMSTRLRINILFCHFKIHNMNNIKVVFKKSKLGGNENFKKSF